MPLYKATLPMRKFRHNCKTFFLKHTVLTYSKMGIEIFTCSGSWCHSVIKCNLEWTLSFQINYAWDLIHSTMQGWEMLNTLLTSFAWAWLFVPCIILQYFMLVLPSKIKEKIDFVPIMCSTPILNPPLLKREKWIFFP